MPVPRTPLTLIIGGANASTETPTRRCGRCLAQFPGDPDADLSTVQEFWMCPACREKLLGHPSLAQL
jgi:DNA-directed RNA polymerase subunit RPC12/RpoP